ncbi:uncharacterized protein LOC141630824 [Silene latifolia]|uniref:uncharacterized protein LOC141630824 n=1 Tax=Silene latifolia TaxID=37657 RepID=UPI003D781300
MVDKLNLNTQEHSNPYKLRWLSKGAEVKVAKQSLVPFSIGKVYRDKVLCDVVPMDSRHLLLGRLWEFDKNSMHHRWSNTCSFKQSTRKITLTPLTPNQRNYGSRSVPAGVKPLIEQYQDVFPAEVPSGLPPLRGIEHQIGLMPGSVLPNRPAYRCDPAATKELQK